MAAFASLFSFPLDFCKHNLGGEADRLGDRHVRLVAPADICRRRRLDFGCGGKAEMQAFAPDFDS